MPAFTPILSGVDLFHVNLLNELVSAINERLAVGSSLWLPHGGVAVGDDVQSRAFWRDLQQRLESLAKGGDESEFLDDAAIAQNMSSIPWMSLPRCFELAGIPAGWRRATVWPGAYSHGPMEVGDIIGPWVFDDIQNMCKSLQQTCTACGAPLDAVAKGAIGYSTPAEGCAAAAGRCNADWLRQPWQKQVVDYYSVGASLDPVIVASATRVRFKPNVTLPLSLPVEVGFWGLVSTPSGWVFSDIDNLGLIPGTYHYFASSGLSPGPIDLVVCPSYIGDDLTNPFPSSGLCPTTGVRGVLVSGWRSVCRWSFSLF